VAVLTVQNVSQAGLAASYTAAAVGGDTFANDGRVFLHVKNGGTGSIDVTIDSVTACNQGFDHNLVVSVPNAQERMIGPFDPSRFNNAGQVGVAYSGVTSVTVAALHL
jgi:hypothetical protein